jgi:hypothetical protein
VCGKDITTDDRYKLVPVDAGLFVIECVTHTTPEQRIFPESADGCSRHASQEVNDNGKR